MSRRRAIRRGGARISARPTEAPRGARLGSAGAAVGLVMATTLSAAGVEAALLNAVGPTGPRAASSLASLLPLLPFLPVPAVLLAGAVLVGVSRARLPLHVVLWIFALAQAALAVGATLHRQTPSVAAAALTFAFVVINAIGIAIVRAPAFRDFVASQDAKRRRRYPVGYGVGVTGGVAAVFAAALAGPVVLLDLHLLGARAALLEPVRLHGRAGVNPLAFVGIPFAFAALAWARRSRGPLRGVLVLTSLLAAGSVPFALRASVDDAILTLLCLAAAVPGVIAAFRPGFDAFWTTRLD